MANEYLKKILAANLNVDQEKLDEALAGLAPTPAENVAKASGSAPTKAEFDALIDALVAAGFMEEASET